VIENLHDLGLFVAVYEERSFTAAAAREHTTQSGVSQRIRKLEDELGLKLFHRGSGQVLPTPAGETYYRHCIDILRRNQSAELSVRQFGGGLDGEVAIGLMPTITRCALAPALAKFMADHPNATIHIMEAYSGVLTDQVKAGHLAFAIVPAFFEGAVGLRSRLFLRTPEVLVSRAGGSLRHLVPVRLGDVGPLSLVVPGAQNTRRHLTENYAAANRVTVDRMIELDSMLATLDLVARSHWAAILPGVMMASDIEEHALVVNPLSDPPLTLDLVLIEPSRSSLSPTAEAFLECLQTETARLHDTWLAEMDMPVPLES
jgi:DNA-binding transcriptional LysR family regulator